MRNLYLSSHSLINLYRTRFFVLLYSSRCITTYPNEAQTGCGDVRWTGWTNPFSRLGEHSQ